MKTTIFALVGAAALGLGLSAFAGDMMNDHDMMMSMDANKDGMVSKDEYMKHHEQMWMKMKKNANGMVELKSMGRMNDDHKMKDKDKMSGEKM
ncbi:MAG: hypothetical protein ABIX37_09735 [Gammaproteobacteria bacterium]